VPGVRSATVSFADEQVVVEYDPAHTSIDTLVETVKALGYQSWNTTEEKKEPAMPDGP
jgi:copper chaperone CopZ